MLLATAATFMLSTTAMAQTTSNNTAADTNQPQNQAAMHGADLQQQVRGNLRQAGFTDIKVVPDSFLVQAKDKTGNPITMMINPDSVTEVVDSGAAGAGQQGQAGAQGTFVSVPPGAAISSKVIGTEVHNSSNQDIGTIKDIALTGHRVSAYIVSVGGFLGVGDRDVAINPADLHVSYNASNKTWTAQVNATKAQLQSAPAFDLSKQA
jgi:hypothetical protein